MADKDFIEITGRGRGRLPTILKARFVSFAVKFSRRSKHCDL